MHALRPHRPLVSLRSRLSLLLAALVLVNLAGACLTLWYTQRTQALYLSTEGRSVTALLAAQDLESALVLQRGLVTSFSLDGDPAWLQELTLRHQSFQKALALARETAEDQQALTVLAAVETGYAAYSQARDEVLALYSGGDTARGLPLHMELRRRFSQLHDQVERYRRLVLADREDAQLAYREKAEVLTWLVWVALPVSLFAGFLLALVLFRQVLGPIRRLAGTALAGGGGKVDDEVQALSLRFRSLLHDVDVAQSELEESREHLVQSEKLALVGKLAAGVAHTIRNPLTSVKMRLFSLERGLCLETYQKEDFEVISEEIGHIDTILRNFLEFARPAKLRAQQLQLAEVVEGCLKLLKHRFESYGVTVEVERDPRLPTVYADADQLKEVILNLLVNACEAMGHGGKITIREEVGAMEPMGKMVVVRLTDTGPGVPAVIRDKVFQPFFSTKGEGSGLGLAIARRIMEEHGGWLHLHSPAGQGATFVLALPIGEDAHWLRS